MPIEFQCGNCQTVLRTPDDSAGKSARCPGCGNVQPIPTGQPSGQPPGISGGFPTQPPAQQNPFARPTADPSNVNPYAPGRTAPMRSPMTAEQAKTRLLPAAITWLVVSILVSLFLMLGVGATMAEMMGRQGQPEDIVALVGTAFFLFLSLMGVLGAILALRMRNRKLAIACAICSMIPGAMCCFLSTGVSVWALVMLLDGEIRPYFS